MNGIAIGALFCALACSSHQPTAQARDRPANTSLRVLAVLDVQSSTPVRAKRRAPRLDAPLTHLASPDDEKSRLAQGPVAGGSDAETRAADRTPDQAAAWDASLASARYARGTALLDSGRVAASVEHLRAAAERIPAARLALAQALLKLKKPDEAKRELRRFLDESRR